jgi:hypothetical protein
MRADIMKFVCSSGELVRKMRSILDFLVCISKGRYTLSVKPSDFTV